MVSTRPNGQRRRRGQGQGRENQERGRARADAVQATAPTLSPLILSPGHPPGGPRSPPPLGRRRIIDACGLFPPSKAPSTTTSGASTRRRATGPSSAPPPPASPRRRATPWGSRSPATAPFMSSAESGLSTTPLVRCPMSHQGRPAHRLRARLSCCGSSGLRASTPAGSSLSLPPFVPACCRLERLRLRRTRPRGSFGAADSDISALLRQWHSATCGPTT
jgi:hypothetical protein